MKIYEMDGKLRKKLFKKVRFKTNRWKKLGWLNILLNIIWIGCCIGLFVSGVTEPVYYEEQPAIVIKMESFMMAFFLPFFFIGVPNLIFRARLFFPVAEINVSEEHKIILKETEIVSDWVANPLMLRAMEATKVHTVVPYNEITKIVWNDTLQRLEIHGNYRQTAKSLHTNKWEERDRVHLTLNKKEKVLHIYNYFPQMQVLMSNLETLSGCRIEN